MGVQINQGDTALTTGLSDSKGRFVFNQGGTGAYQWGLLAPGASVEEGKVLGIEVQQGATTKIVSADGDSYVVQTPGTARDLYLKFEQNGDSFTLKRGIGSRCRGDQLPHARHYHDCRDYCRGGYRHRRGTA